MEEIKGFISDLADILQTKNLSEIETEIEGTRIRIRGRDHGYLVENQVPTLVMAPAASPVVATAPEKEGIAIKAPIVGTFYSAATPGAPDFIKVGDSVEKGQALFILEAMKTMNEITSSHNGVVAEILAANGDMVQYGDTVVVLE